MKRNRKLIKSQRGQVLVEYALMLLLFAVISLTFLLLLSAMFKHGWRVLSLVAWEPFT